MEPLFRLSGSLGLAEIDLATYHFIKARAETGQSLSKSDWLIDSTKDWFCGTKLCDAKSFLYHVVAPETSDHERLRNFKQLREAVALGYRDRFVEVDTSSGFSVGIMANVRRADVFSFLSLYEFSDPTTVCCLEHIQREINVEVEAALGGLKSHKYMGEFTRDSAEAVFNIEGVLHAPVGLEQSAFATAWDLVQPLVDELRCTEEQLSSIFALGRQRMFQIVAGSALEENGGLLTKSEIMYHTGPSKRLDYKFRHLGGDIEMKGYNSLLPLSRDVQKNSRELPLRRHLAPDPVQSFVLSIAPDGTATITSALFGWDPRSAQAL